MGCGRSHDTPVDVVLKTGVVLHTRARSCSEDKGLEKCVKENGDIAFLGKKESVKEIKWQ